MTEEFVIIDYPEYNRYGWVKDRKDIRDCHYTPPLDENLPRKFSLRDKMPPVLDQGKLGSCTANGICNAIRYCEMKEGVDNNESRSRLFVYYNEREMEGTVDSDSGAQIRDGIKSVNKLGACFEKSWPYDIDKFALKPAKNCYTEASKHRAVKYEKITQVINHIKSALYSGYPIVFGFRVYESIEKPTVTKSGIIPLPAVGNEPIGGHCIVCCGWDDNRRLFEIQNSWSEEWGNNGYGYMSYDYLSNPELSSDFWKISFVD